MSEWDSYFDNLPNSPIGELEISLKAGKIRAATYGRGLWEAPLYGEAGGDAPSSIVDHASSTAIKLVPNSTNDLLRIDITSELAYVITSYSIHYTKLYEAVRQLRHHASRAAPGGTIAGQEPVRHPSRADQVPEG